MNVVSERIKIKIRKKECMMHEYYESKKEKLKKTMNGYLKPISKELEEETGTSFSKLEEEVWEYYELNLLEHFPYIGGDKISGTRNLTGAYMFVALGVVCQRYGMTLDRWGYLCTVAYRRFFEKIPKCLRSLARKVLMKSDFTTKMLKKKDVKNHENALKNPGSFETQTQEPTKEYPVMYYNLVCPLADFAKKYGYMEYMPYICNLDYVMFEVLNVPFYREKTCARGDEYCDFKMKKNAPVQASWPCHGLK